MPITRLQHGDTLVLASGNRGKLAELKTLLEPFALSVVAITDYYTKELAEEGSTFAANALQKAQFAHKLTGLTALADDSGFCVDALAGAPGIYSARWAGKNKDFARAMQRINSETSHQHSAAHFTCVLALVQSATDFATYHGEVHGTTTWPPRGKMGFGYDPMFIPDGWQHTFAEIPAAQKESISHRSRAFTLFQTEALPRNEPT